MKTSIFLAICLAITVGVYAGPTKSINYVTANGQTFFGDKLKSGLFHTRLLTSGQETVRINNNDVTAYMQDGRLFERLPLVCNNNTVKDEVFMEYVTTRSGLRLYKYSSYDENDNLPEGVVCKANAKYCFFVFKDGKYYLKVDEKNAAATLPFFGIAVRD
jgi:hypothetical protein